MEKEIHLLDLIELDFLQSMQDFFSNTMGFASISVDEDGPLTESSNFTSFCNNLTRKTPEGFKRCNACDICWGKAAAEKGEPVIYTCHTGLTDFAVPIIVDGKHIASILGGQVLTEPPDEEKFRKIARELGIDEEDYLKELKKIKIVPKEMVEAAARLLFIITNAISCMAHLNLKLSEFGFDYKLHKNVKFEDLFFNMKKKDKCPISEREFEILKLIVLGKNNSEIAKDLFISVHTVKKHVSSILTKLEVEDRVQVAVKAIKESLV